MRLVERRGDSEEDVKSDVLSMLVGVSALPGRTHWGKPNEKPGGNGFRQEER